MSGAAKRRHESIKEKSTANKKASACPDDAVPIVESPFDKNSSQRKADIECEDGSDTSSLGDTGQDYEDDVLDEEDMLAEIKRNEDQLKKVEANLRKGRIREELLESRRKLAEINDQPVTKGNPRSFKTAFQVNDLRRIPQLTAEVNRQMAQLGLESNSSDSEQDSPDNYDVKTGTSNAQSARSSRSGIQAKSSDRVLCPQNWPHSSLQFQYASRNFTFTELPFHLFVAGELEIISQPMISTVERQGRLSLLKRILYFSEVYDFKGLLEYYAAFVRKIEMGISSWQDENRDLDSILVSYIKVQRPVNPDRKPIKRERNEPQSFSSREDMVWFCTYYQRNKCTQSSSHMSIIRGQNRKVLHICAACWKQDGLKLEHPESSSACPHRLSTL